MRLRMVLLFATATLALAGTSTASADIIRAYGKITYSNGGTCAAGLCQLVITGANFGAQFGTTQSLTNFVFTGNSWPDGGNYVVGKSISYNALVQVPTQYWPDGWAVYAQARESCGGGGYHYSGTHSFLWDNYHDWWGGTFQLGSGCQI